MLEILTIAALIIGPISAVQVQNLVAYYKERKARKLHIFRVLMATRAEPLAKEHVRVLNLISIDFSDKYKKEKPVINAWKLLLDQLESYPDSENYKDESKYERDYQDAEKKYKEYFTDLLLEMSKYFGYGFDKIHIKNDWYVPSGHSNEQKDKHLVLNGLVELLTGETPLNVNIENLPKKPSGKKAKSKKN